MEIAALLSDKTIKPKAKVETLAGWLLEGKVSMDDLIFFAETAKDPVKGSCIEAVEFASKVKPAIVDKNCFLFITKSLAAKAPRVKWESARVVGNTAHLFQNNLSEAIMHLLENAEHEGTVVRWSAAFALGQIIQLNTKFNKDLLPAIEAICSREEKNSIKKIYTGALKKIR